MGGCRRSHRWSRLARSPRDCVKKGGPGNRSFIFWASLEMRSLSRVKKTIETSLAFGPSCPFRCLKAPLPPSSFSVSLRASADERRFLAAVLFSRTCWECVKSHPPPSGAGKSSTHCVFCTSKTTTKEGSFKTTMKQLSMWRNLRAPIIAMAL